MSIADDLLSLFTNSSTMIYQREIYCEMTKKGHKQESVRRRLYDFIQSQKIVLLPDGRYSLGEGLKFLQDIKAHVHDFPVLPLEIHGMKAHLQGPDGLYNSLKPFWKCNEQAHYIFKYFAIFKTQYQIMIYTNNNIVVSCPNKDNPFDIYEFIEYSDSLQKFFAIFGLNYRKDFIYSDFDINKDHLNIKSLCQHKRTEILEGVTIQWYMRKREGEDVGRGELKFNGKAVGTTQIEQMLNENQIVDWMSKSKEKINFANALEGNTKNMQSLQSNFNTDFNIIEGKINSLGKLIVGSIENIDKFNQKINDLVSQEDITETKEEILDTISTVTGQLGLNTVQIQEQITDLQNIVSNQNNLLIATANTLDQHTQTLGLQNQALRRIITITTDIDQNQRVPVDPVPNVAELNFADIPVQDPILRGRMRMLKREKLLRFLQQNPNCLLTRTELGRKLHLKRGTVNRYIHDFIAQNIIQENNERQISLRV